MSSSGLSSEDVRNITNEQIGLQLKPLHDALNRLAEQHAQEALERRQESKERRQESRETNEAIKTMATCITELSGGYEKIEDRFKYNEEKHNLETAHIYGEISDHTNWLESNSTKIGALEVSQAENRKHINLAWSIAGGIATIALTVMLSFYGDYKSDNRERHSEFVRAINGMATAINKSAETNRYLVLQQKEENNGP